MPCLDPCQQLEKQIVELQRQLRRCDRRKVVCPPVQTVNLSVAQSNAGNVNVNAVFSYTITVSNTLATAATQVNVIAILDYTATGGCVPKDSFTVAVSSGTAGAVFTNEIEWQLTLAAAASATLTVTFVAGLPLQGFLTSRAIVGRTVPVNTNPTFAITNTVATII